MKTWISSVSSRTEGKTWLAELEARENGRKPASRICVCSYNKVFGYYLEVTNSYKEPGAGELDPQTDAGQCRALYYAGIKRAGRYDPWCGG